MDKRLLRRRWALLVVVIAGAILILLRFGGDLLTHTDPLPRHAQVAVVLNGSVAGFTARRAEAVDLLRRGIVDRVMVSVPPGGYWGENIPLVAQQYFEENFGPQVANRIVYCVSDADSTIEEARALVRCLESSREWRSLIIVTSVYHTRRAGRIWRAALAKVTPPYQLCILGIVDADFNRKGWWRNRRYAKTWFLEISKLAWESIFGVGPWKSVPPKAELLQPSLVNGARNNNEGPSQ